MEEKNDLRRSKTILPCKVGHIPREQQNSLLEKIIQFHWIRESQTRTNQRRIGKSTIQEIVIMDRCLCLMINPGAVEGF